MIESLHTPLHITFLLDIYGMAGHRGNGTPSHCAVLDNLEAAGLIRRISAGENRPRYDITAKGCAMVRRLLELPIKSDDVDEDEPWQLTARFIKQQEKGSLHRYRIVYYKNSEPFFTVTRPDLEVPVLGVVFKRDEPIEVMGLDRGYVYNDLTIRGIPFEYLTDGEGVFVWPTYWEKDLVSVSSFEEWA